MNTHIYKAQTHRNQTVSNKNTQGQNGVKSVFQFTDNRPETLAQRKLQDQVNNSRQMARLSGFQAAANSSFQVKQATQLKPIAGNDVPQNKQAFQAKENKTGLPDHLKNGIENLSGMSMDDVKVHRNSEKPAQLQAEAYAQGADIYLGPGQEKHLPHEAWHVVQQKQGRVKPTMQMKGKVNVNDDVGLESEADIMGARASSYSGKGKETPGLEHAAMDSAIVQRAVGFEYELDGSDVMPRYSEGKKGFLGIGKEASKPLVELKKGLVIVDFGTFDVSVDETPNGGFDIEIRIKEIDHISRDSLDGLRGTVTNLLAVIRTMARQKERPFPATVLGGDENILITGDFSSGSVQATTGLSLSALHGFMSGEMGDVHERRQHALIKHLGEGNPDTENQTIKAFYLRNYGKGSALLLQKALDHTKIVFPSISATEQTQLAAVIASILTIPITARENKLPYAKSATTLLARSDYATVFNQLPATVLMNKTMLKNLIMVTLNTYLALKELPQAGFDSRVYPAKSIKESEGLSLTLGDWLGNLIPAVSSVKDISVSKDLLSKDNYPKDKYGGDDFSQLESLGGYGSKTDPGERGSRLPLFEFRKYLKVPNNHLLQVLEGIWELVHLANKKR